MFRARHLHLGFTFLLLIAIFISVSDSAFCTVYYVSNSGDDSASGESESTPWKTISRVNRALFSHGDSVRFKRGDVFSDETLKTPRVNNFTIYDYGVSTASLPWINGNMIQPINIRGSMSNLTIKNIDISGQNWQKSKDSNLVVQNVSGVTLQNINGNGHAGGTVSAGKTAITITNCSGLIEVSGCKLSNWGPASIPTVSQDFMGIAIMDIKQGIISIHDNLVHDLNADCLYFSNSTPEEALVYDNILYNAGENCLDAKGIHNLRVFQNEMYREPRFIGWGGNRIADDIPLVVIHYVPPGGMACSNVNIYENTLHDSPNGSGIRVAGHKSEQVRNVKISHNKLARVRGCIHIANHVSDTTISFNDLISPQMFDTKDGDIGGIYCNNSGARVSIVGNRIYSSDGSLECAVNLQATGPETEIRENLIYIDKRNPTSSLLRCTAWPFPPSIDYNCWFNKSGIKIIKYKDQEYTKANFYRWKKIHRNDYITDPEISPLER